MLFVVGVEDEVLEVVGPVPPLRVSAVDAVLGVAVVFVIFVGDVVFRLLAVVGLVPAAVAVLN